MDKQKLKRKLHEIIFEAETFYGKVFDITLLIAIITSVLIVMLDSVLEIRKEFKEILIIIEWIVTILFTIEFFIRIWIIKSPKNYIFSFFGFIDLISILPTYIQLFYIGTPSLLIIRSLRLLRIFRILKLVRFIDEAMRLIESLKASFKKIVVFILGVLTIAVIIGALMYQIEGPENGFTNIPKSVYWAIVTLTTVGYGDIYPHTVLGQIIASILMILGYGIIAVPTGIVGAEIIKADFKSVSTITCPSCSTEGHEKAALYCKKCGLKLSYDS